LGVFLLIGVISAVLTLRNLRRAGDVV